jgi:DNA-nicking Smr family endonuclease
VEPDDQPEDEPIVLPITDVFDLHSVPPRDVRGITEAYLEEAYSRGFTVIRIIHGRGIGVQREMVRAVLGRTPFVVEFGDAPAEAGGWGATVARLRVSGTGAGPVAGPQPAP